MTHEQDRILRSIEADQRLLLARVQEHHTTLYGNGTPGLKSAVQALAANQANCPARAAYKPENRGILQQIFANWLAVLALLVAVVAIFVS